MRLPHIAALALLLAPVAAADASLAVGAKAPEFRTRGAIAGKPFDLSLASLLRKGPVVLYFFPAAFTPGCTLEAHQFAEATDDFRKLGATVVGMSADPIDKLQKFSVQECRNKFAVATATPGVIAAYDVKLPPRPNLPPQLANVTSRTSYVIVPGGRVIFVHDDLDYRDHVRLTLAAVRNWRAGAKQR